jgi:hypothetical protein
MAVDNGELSANVSSGFPVLSIKGKTFTVRRGKKSTMLTRKDADGDQVPVNAIEVVLIKANRNFSKTYYAKGYVEGSDAKPDCFSNDGIAPDASVQNPQAKKCAVCPKNVWGAKVSDEGKKLKACQDVRRVAVAALNALDDPMLLRVPPASLKGLASYARDVLEPRKVSYNAVLTKVRFAPEASTPKLLFTPLQFLTEEQYQEAAALAESGLVQDIIGLTGTPMHVDEEEAPPQPPEVTAPAPAPAPKTKKPAAPVSAADVDEVLGDTPVPTKPKQAAGATLEVPVDEEVAALLASLDD